MGLWLADTSRAEVRGTISAICLLGITKRTQHSRLTYPPPNAPRGRPSRVWGWDPESPDSNFISYPRCKPISQRCFRSRRAPSISWLKFAWSSGTNAFSQVSGVVRSNLWLKFAWFFDPLFLGFRGTLAFPGLLAGLRASGPTPPSRARKKLLRMLLVVYSVVSYSVGP